jgi:hypothetical protein
MQRDALFNLLCALQSAGFISSQIGESGEDYYSISCLFAKYRHKGGTDRTPSMAVKIDPEGPSFVYCHMCGYRKNLGATMVDLNVLTRGKIRGLTDWVLESDKKTKVFGTKKAQQKKIKTFNYSENLRKYLADRMPEDAYSFLAGKGCPKKIVKYLHFAWVEHEVVTKWDGSQYEVNRHILIPTLSRVGGSLVCVGGQARAIDDVHRGGKYFNLLKFHTKLYLYGEHLLHLARGKRLFVLEGGLDAGHFMSEGEHAVGLMGLYLSQQKLAKIVATQPRVVYVILDPDQESEEGKKRIANIVRYIQSSGLIAIPIIPPKDPKQLPREEILALIGGVNR